MKEIRAILAVIALGVICVWAIQKSEGFAGFVDPVTANQWRLEREREEAAEKYERWLEENPQFLVPPAFLNR